ncbi:MAG: hypothetical protein FWF13_04440, partial [Acidobacteria bacterium]|nr:hypothetical protein [Acidobacteriota bacterium]
MTDFFDEYAARMIPDDLAILKSTLYHLSEGVVVADMEGRFLLCNQTAQKLLKIAADGGTPRMWADIKGCCKADGLTPYTPADMPN